MKVFGVCLVFLALFASSGSCARLADADKTGAVGKVVKMLQTMLKQSQDDWASDKKAYADFECYCDENTDKKTVAIQEATTSISLLGNKIDELQGSNGALSIKAADLKANIAENEEARANAKALREKEEKAFQGESDDLTAAIGQMDEAVKLLTAIGADQTLSSSADHEKFMGKYKDKSLVSLKSSMKVALMAASSFVDPTSKAKIIAFLQGPFTGTYSSQSGQIVGILKDMKQTFQDNLESAKATEKVSKESYEKFKENKEAEHTDLKTSYNAKQATLGTNDADLSTKKGQMRQFTKQKDEDSDFLGKLTVQCADKKKAYEKRKLFAANEDLALSQAIAILDNDTASAKFGAVEATSKGKTGFLLQVSADDSVAEASELLRKAAMQQHSARLNKVFVLLQAGNPFSSILEQITKMTKLIDEEQKVDEEQKTWCETTNDKNNQNLDGTKDSLNTIESDITKLKNSLNDPKTGMKQQLKDAEESLKTNLKNQGEETATRRKENLDYQKDVSTMSDAISMLAKADKVLTGYYESLDNEQVGLMQRGIKQAPKTFEGSYKGQNEQAKKVLSMLAFISSESAKEQQVAHDGELKSQHDYEDSMKSLVEGEASVQETIAKINEDIAKAEKELEGKHEDQENTEQGQIALERYMEKIKPGCDSIQKNYDVRTTNRAAEKKALQGVKSKLKATPAFASAQQKAKEAAFGKCKGTCLKDEAAAQCKACLAGVSVPGYCAGHSGVKGC